jgi:hypothetical protein
LINVNAIIRVLWHADTDNIAQSTGKSQNPQKYWFPRFQKKRTIARTVMLPMNYVSPLKTSGLARHMLRVFLPKLTCFNSSRREACYYMVEQRLFAISRSRCDLLLSPGNGRYQRTPMNRTPFVSMARTMCTSIQTLIGRDIFLLRSIWIGWSMTGMSLNSLFQKKAYHCSRILDLVFKFFTSWCLRIVPPLFLRDMYRALKVPKTQTPPRLSHYSPMLHNAILALGTAFSDVPTLRDLKTRLYFLEKAKSYIEVECSRPHISVVNALSLIASFYSSQGDQTLGFVYFGKFLLAAMLVHEAERVLRYECMHRSSM